MRNVFVISVLVLVPAFLMTGCEVSSQSTPLSCADWGYGTDNGPTEWASMCSTTCSASSQSPVDIARGSVSEIDLPAISIQYVDTEFEWFNNGHTLEAEDGHPGDNTISVGGTAYELLQFHFHALSEHTIDGQHSAIELHLVHRASDTELAVIGVMINQGAENPHFASLWSALPADESVAPAHISLNPAELLPANAEYYRYDGSLTTPNGSNPAASCAEIVNWHVMKDGIEMSAGQIAAFQGVFDHNYRPVQALNGRQIQG